MGIERIIPNVQAADLAATVEFYRDFIGLVVDMEMPEDEFVMLSSASVTSAQVTINDNGFRGLPPADQLVDQLISDRARIAHDPFMSLGCTLAVVEDHRRRGVGRRLAAARISAAHRRGARTVVSALSPDGWERYRTLGFRSEPVEPDRCFYLREPAHS